jgi:integrase
LTDAKIDLFVEKASAMGYSHYTVENTRWNLRALWNHAHLEGIRADLPGGPRVPVNVPPARLVEDITSAVAIHRASVELEQRKDAKQAETPRQVLSMVGGALKRLFTPPAPPTRPPVVVAPPAPDREPESLTLSEVAAAWRTIAGKDLTTAEVVNMTCALRPMEVLYGHELASLFGAKKLKAVRDLMVGGYDSGGKHFRGLCRKQVNARMGRIKRVFKWAASEELVPVAVYQAIATLAALRPGRTTAPERLPVMPVDDAVFRSTLPFLSPVLAAMAELQYLGAMRPGEACVMRPCDLDRSGDVWEYRPHAHKGIWRSRERVVYIGPQAQKILEPFLDRDPEQYCFVPREAMFWRREKRRRERKSAVQPSQIDRSNPGPTKRPGVRYTTSSYSKAIKYACRKHHLPHWHPNQLRHAMATRVRKEFGLESAQVVLGHSRADVTQVYGERNKTLALDAVRKIG